MALFPAPIWSVEQRALLTALAVAVRARRGLDVEPFRTRWRDASASHTFDWDAFVAFAKRHRVIPFAYEVVRDHGTDLAPASVRVALKDEARRLLFFAEGSFQRLKTLSASLSRAGLGHAAYKGPALALQAYGSVGVRTFGDLDVLVARTDLERVVAWAKREGYTLPEWDDVQLRAWTLTNMHHLSAFRSSAFGDAHLELHWMTLPPMMRPGTPDVDVWLGETLDEADGVPVLPWPRAWSANAEHHAKHGWSRLMLLVDCAVRPLGKGEADPVLKDALGVAVLEATRALAESLTNDTLDRDAPSLLLRTWHAEDPYQFEVGEAYLDHLDPAGAWARRRQRFRAVASASNAKEIAYGVARQAYLEALVAAGIVFGMRPNDTSPWFQRVRAIFR